ncbi:MAG TPA: hypothetical protein VG963_10735 [Polyangiaceae bacterium]|nr:hypothetical protein [Polyangiaceae bacterium]
MLSFIMLSACGASKTDADDDDTTTEPTLVADAAADYSPSTQGVNGWSYRRGEGTDTVEMTVGTDAWGDTTWCNASDRNSAFFGPDGAFLRLHPGLVTNTVLRWTAPAKGRYRLQLSTRKEDVGGGDGVQTTIYRNDQPMATQTLAFDQSTEISNEFDSTLLVGDTLSAEVNELSDGFNDSTGLEFVVLRQE